MSHKGPALNIALCEERSIIPEEREILSCPGNKDSAGPLAEEDRQSRGEKAFSSFLLFCAYFHKKSGRNLAFRLTFASIHILLIIFQNHHEWTKP